MRASFTDSLSSRIGSPVRLAFACLVAWTHSAAIALLASLALSPPAAAQSVKLQNSNALRPMGTTSGVSGVGATIIDRLAVAKYSDVNLGGASLPTGGHATLVLRPDGGLIAEGRGNPHVDASFSAVFTLTGEPNQTFGISLPHSMPVTTGAITQSIRTFLHDAGQTPLLGTGGNGRFNVGAVFSVGREGAGHSQTEVYIGAINVIVSNN